VRTGYFSTLLTRSEVDVEGDGQGVLAPVVEEAVAARRVLVGDELPRAPVLLGLRHDDASFYHAEALGGAEVGALGRAVPPRIDVIVCDLDGTFLRSDGSMSPASVEALAAARAAGIEILCATGRTPRGVRRIAGHEQLGLMVCAGGAVLYDARTDQVIAERCFDADGTRERLSAMRARHPEWAYAALTSRRMFVEPRYFGVRDPRHGGERDPHDREVVDDVGDVVIRSDVVCVAVRHPGLEAEIFLPLVESGFDGVGTATRGSAVTVDVAPFGTTKGTAVARVLQELGARPERCVAFGDMPADLPLFALAGYAIAVQNAAPAVKAAADRITATNDLDGVARSIADLLA
jgi:Cof subfamily protein (haloacid dehalogenase superfamily)